MELASNITDTISRPKSPTNITELGLNFGLYNGSRQIGSTFSQIASTLNQHLKKDQLATYRSLIGKKLLAMKTLKSLIIAPPVLALPYSGGNLTLDTDLCNVQIDLILLQGQRDKTTVLL